MYTKNIIGVKTDPCGAPLFASNYSDFSSFINCSHFLSFQVVFNPVL